MNALDTIGRVICIVGLLFVVAVFWQRERFKKFALARAGKPTFMRTHFCISIVASVVVFSMLPTFFQSCTGFHLSARRSMIMSLGGFVACVALFCLMYFVIEKHRAQHPKPSVRVGFVLVAIAGIFFVVALWFDHLGHR
jgi:uncharacterized membrane protein YwzB